MFFFFAVTYLPYLVQLLIVIPYRESVCMLCGWGGEWGFIPCFPLTLSLFSCTLQAFGVSWFLGCGLCMFACVCMRGPFGVLLCNFNILGFHTYAYVVGVVRGVWALNILVRHTIVSPCSVAIPYSESVCMLCWWGRGWGFIACFSLTLSPSSCTLRAFGVSWFHWRGWCLYACVCVRGFFGALLRIFNILGVHTYAYVAGPVRGVCVLDILVRHTIVFPCSVDVPFFFSVVMYSAVLGVYGGMGIWVWFVFVRMLYDVRGGSLFVSACGVVPLAPSFTTYLVSSPTPV